MWLKLCNFREVNPIFEGNQQQDAHELLVCLLDNIRETFQLLVKQRERQSNCQTNGTATDHLSTSESPIEAPVENNSSVKRNLRKSWKKKKATTTGKSTSSSTKVNGVALENGHSENPISESNSNTLTRGQQNIESKKCFHLRRFRGCELAKDHLPRVRARNRAKRDVLRYLRANWDGSYGWERSTTLLIIILNFFC